jgi:K+-sensing histidine kinase KdpD
LIPRRGSRINAAIFNFFFLSFSFSFVKKKNHFIFSLAKFTYSNTLVGFGLLTHQLRARTNQT